MSCLQTLAGIAKDCGGNVAGISKVWLMNFDAVTPTFTSNKLSALLPKDASDDLDDVCFGYNFRKQTGSFTSTLTKEEANGTTYWTNEIAMQFSKLETSKHLEVKAMCDGELVAIVKDNNGKYWYIGHNDYVTATAGTGQTGQSFGDLNGYNITLQQISADMPEELLGTATTRQGGVTTANLIETLESI